MQGWTWAGLFAYFVESYLEMYSSHSLIAKFFIYRGLKVLSNITVLLWLSFMVDEPGIGCLAG